MEPILLESKRVWAKRGKKLKRLIRCTSGKKKGRVVSGIGVCSTAIDIKKRFLMKRTRKRLNTKMVMKSRRTKRTNPTSKRLAALNQATNRK